MTMTVKRASDSYNPTGFYSNNGKIADIPNGVTVVVADLVNGSVLPDCTAIGADSSGKRSVCKSAKVLAGSTATAIKVDATTNQFKVGDKIFYGALNTEHYAITEVATASGVTTLTVGTAIDTPSEGGFIYENADVADGATGSALKVSPVAITGTNMLVDTSDNMHVDAWVQAAVKKDTIGSVILAALVANYAFISQI